MDIKWYGMTEEQNKIAAESSKGEPKTFSDLCNKEATEKKCEEYEKEQNFQSKKDSCF